MCYVSPYNSLEHQDVQFWTFAVFEEKIVLSDTLKHRQDVLESGIVYDVD